MKCQQEESDMERPYTKILNITLLASFGQKREIGFFKWNVESEGTWGVCELNWTMFLMPMPPYLMFRFLTVLENLL